MTNSRNESSNEFLFIPILSALVFILIVAALLWVTQIRPSLTQPVEASLLPSETEAAAEQPVLGDPAAGHELYLATCSACHGPDAAGVPGLGKSLIDSEFTRTQTDAELIEFIKVGRDPSDPLNTTGIAMPPKGGNPALTDEDLQNIVSHIRTLQQ